MFDKALTLHIYSLSLSRKHLYRVALPVAGEGGLGRVEVGDEAAAGDPPHPHAAVLAGAGDHVVIERVPLHI